MLIGGLTVLSVVAAAQSLLVLTGSITSWMIYISAVVRGALYQVTTSDTFELELFGRAGLARAATFGALRALAPVRGSDTKPRLIEAWRHVCAVPALRAPMTLLLVMTALVLNAEVLMPLLTGQVWLGARSP